MAEAELAWRGPLMGSSSKAPHAVLRCKSGGPFFSGAGFALGRRRGLGLVFELKNFT